jgi:hypothetical protein
MFETLWLDIAAFFGALHVLSPALLRYTMRFSAKCNPTMISPNALPDEVSAGISSRIPELGNLGFAYLGCYDFGTLSSGTHSYSAFFCNRATSDFASVTVMETTEIAVGYLEFSTQFANGLVLETNTNGLPPLTPENPEHRVFRFPRIESADALYRLHRQLLKKYAPGLWPEAEPKGEELNRFVRVIENFGPRHESIGYMKLTEDGQSYMPTWKGACLMAWRGLWPTSILRRVWQRYAMRSELKSLEVRGVTALQKA